MLSKNELKDIRSLHEAKGRSAQRRFIAEGIKLTGEMLGAFPCELLLVGVSAAQGVEEQLRTLAEHDRPKRLEVVPESFDWSRISSQRQPQPLLGVFTLPEEEETLAMPTSGLALFLDRIQDPGNLGTIIRTADWFGLEDIYLAPGTADPFAPKVVQATMGALGRVRLHRLKDSIAFLRSFDGVRVGTFLGGEDLYTADFSEQGRPTLIIMGNEGQGIHPELEPFIDRRLTIPPYPLERAHTESLNVAIATALILGELRRRG